MKRVCILLAACLVLSPGLAFGNNELVLFDPDEIAVPDDLTESETTKALMTAFVMSSWSITDVSRDSGYIDAELPVRRHVARVRARINNGVISFHYRKSDNLPHKWRTERNGTV